MGLNDVKEIETLLIKQLSYKELAPLEIENLFYQYQLEDKSKEDLKCLLEPLMGIYLSTSNVILSDNLDCLTNIINFQINVLEGGI